MWTLDFCLIMRFIDENNGCTLTPKNANRAMIKTNDSFSLQSE